MSMKFYLLSLALLLSIGVFSQSKEEKEILDLSQKIFGWEVSGQMDSLENVFHSKFMVVGSSGKFQYKKDYLERLRSGNFIHHKINVESSQAQVEKNTATLVGQGLFDVTASGQSSSLHLSYVEVFTRDSPGSPWKVLLMKANLLEH